MEIFFKLSAYMFYLTGGVPIGTSWIVAVILVYSIFLFAGAFTEQNSGFLFPFVFLFFVLPAVVTLPVVIIIQDSMLRDCQLEHSTATGEPERVCVYKDNYYSDEYKPK